MPGAGRCLFAGFQETWRWQALDGEAFYGRFWMQTLRYVARARQSQVTLNIDRPGPYREGETLRLVAHFGDESPASAEGEHDAHVVKLPDGTNWREPLRPVADARGWYEAKLENVAAGAYRFRLASPLLSSAPTLVCQVLERLGEMDRVALDEDELQAAAAGKWYPLSSVSELVRNVPVADERALGPVREVTLWDHPFLWGLILLLLAGEWLVRRWKGML
jgi:hypothetical protein